MMAQDSHGQASSPSAPSTTGLLPVAGGLGAAVHQLELAVAEQERAVTRILGLVELLMDKAPDRATRARLEGIFEACGFQDLTGQRIQKVNRFLRYLSGQVGDATVPAPARPLDGPDGVSGPAAPGKGLTQAEVDRLLRGA